MEVNFVEFTADLPPKKTGPDFMGGGHSCIVIVNIVVGNQDMSLRDEQLRL